MNKRYLFFITFVSTLGGFLFGFDTAVISGAEGKIQELFALNDWWHGFTISIALYGTVIGALLGGLPADKFGRKKTLIVIAILYTVSALGCAFSFSWEALVLYRFIGGLGVGASSVVGPMYISEVSPPKYRGRLVMLFQFNVVSGILIAYLSNYLIGGIGPNDWRWMLGVETLPATIFFILLFLIPESPRWLVKQGKTSEARKTLMATGEEAPDKVVDEIKASLKNKNAKSTESFFGRKYSFPIILAFLFAFFNQVSGINVIIYYAPRIFEMAGIGKEAALLSSVGIGMVNLVFTIIAFSIIDKYGRRKLMLIGSLGLILFLFLISMSFFLGPEGANYLAYFIFGYVAFFSISQGAVIWVFISEVFPNKVRAQGQSFGSSTHWILAAIITQVFPGITAMIGGGPTFLFFFFMMILQLLYVVYIMPETKGISLEELEKVILKNEYKK